MMFSSTVLLIARDPAIAEFVREEAETIEGIATRWVAEIDEVCSQPLGENVRLVVLAFDGTIDEDEVARLLWVTSAAARHEVPLVVLSESYNVEEALTLFRLGVTDYISLADQSDSISSLVQALALRIPLPIDSSPEEEVFSPSPGHRGMVRVW
jgi:DNA-binding response OmpR family regulator